MIISNKYKFIWFFPVGHTASTSLFFSMREELYDDKDCRIGKGLLRGENTSKEYAGDPAAPIVLTKHMPTDVALESGLSEEKFYSYTKISVCRNPYTLMGSMMRKNIGVTHFSEKNIKSYLNTPWMFNTQNYNGQTSLLCDVDKIIKFEELLKEFEKFKKDFLIEEDIPLVRYFRPHEHTEINYIENFTRDGINFMNERYAEDFEKLGYEKL